MELYKTIKIISGLSFAGLLFSGYLTFSEIFKKTCVLGGGCTYIGSLPSCFYGFIMYLIIFSLTVYAIMKTEFGKCRSAGENENKKIGKVMKK